MPRVFVALLLGEQVRKNVAAQITRLRTLSKAVTWVMPGNLHLTLSFLGDQTDEQLRDIVPALEEAAEGVSGFPMGLRGLGAFPGLEHPRTIWVGVPDSGGEVRYLQSRVAEALERRGILFETRAWKPHVTIGRIPPQRRWRRDGMAEVRSGLIRAGATVFGNSQISSIELMRSDLFASGARYTPIASVPLSPP